MMASRLQVEPDANDSGRRQMRALAETTLQALERAGLRDLAADLERRVLDLDLDAVSEATWAEDEGWHVAYKPIIELLLCEIRHVARAPHMASADRRARIAWAMKLAGV
jgi:hypothetical protein